MFAAACMLAAAGTNANEPLPDPSGDRRGVTAPYGSVCVPLTFAKRTNSYYVRVTAGGKALNLVVDTGAVNTVIDLAAAKRLGLVLTSRGNARFFDGIRRVTYSAELKDLRTGAVRRESLAVEVADMSDLATDAGRADGVEFGGVLGGSFLKAYAAVIDYRNDVMFLDDVWAWDMQLLQGEWVAVAGELAGTPIRHRVYLSGFRISVEGERYKEEREGYDKKVFGYEMEVATGLLQIDPVARPKVFGQAEVVVNGRAKSAGGGIVGLYEVDRNTFRMAIPSRKVLPINQLPRSLTSTPENGMCVLTYRRVLPNPVVEGAIRATRYITSKPPVQSLLGVVFPPGGEYRFEDWTYTPAANGVVVAESADHTLTARYRKDGLVTVTSSGGATLTLPAPPIR